MYIFGFREGWLSIFPTHSAFMIDLIVFGLLYAIAYKSADLAIKTQYIIMGIIVISLITIVFASYYGSMQIPTEAAARWGTFRGSAENGYGGVDFWMVFAVFFPAATGIMAGANMSGELKNPRQSIPKGTLWAIGVSFVIYMVLAYWIARSASEQELISNYNIIIERSFWPPAMIAGVLGATFSSALASIIGSSRILFAMGQHRVLPKGEWLEIQDDSGQPRNAMIVTGILIFSTMLLRDLNAIAPLVTMFFLVTYAMLNVVVIVEQRLGLISFRPLFKVNKYIPWVGLIGSLLAMFIINPTVSLVSWALMFVVYSVLSRAHLETPFESVRSGLFSSFSEWAAKHTAGITHKQERSWKPNFLVPTTDATSVQGAYTIIRDIAYSKGSATLMGINADPIKGAELKNWLQDISESFKKAGVYSSTSLMKTQNFGQGVNFGNQALNSAFFKPNIIFLSMNEDANNISHYQKIATESENLGLGIVLYVPHQKALLGQQQSINVWIDDRGDNWDIDIDTGNIDLPLLIAYKLKLNWNARIRLIAIANNIKDERKASNMLNDIVDLARLPINNREVLIGDIDELIIGSPKADLNIFCNTELMSTEYCNKTMERMKSTCLFIKDSGHENILA
jgi:amino acid transporter